MQISRSADADWPTSRPTWLLRCFGCSPDATRIQLLWALADRELSVNDLAGRVGKPSPSVSQHLAKLRMARLVRNRREGNQGFYLLETDHVRQLVTDAVYTAEHAAGGVPAHHLDNGELRLLHEKGTG